MQTKTKAERVREAIGECERYFVLRGKEFRAPTERVEQLWFEVEARIEAAEAAESKRDFDTVQQQIAAILRYVARIEAELPA